MSVIDLDAVDTVSVPPVPPGTGGEPPLDVGDLYILHRPLLLHIACRKFRIGETEAESLLQEVFVSFMTTTTKVENVKAWLVAAMCNASRHYWRAQGRTEPLPDDYVDRLDPTSQGLAERYALLMTIQQAMQYLAEKCRDTLHLHYFEGHSAVEVAAVLETTPRYAEKLIHNCLQRVRQIYISITTVQK